MIFLQLLEVCYPLCYQRSRQVCVEFCYLAITEASHCSTMRLDGSANSTRYILPTNKSAKVRSDEGFGILRMLMMCNNRDVTAIAQTRFRSFNKRGFGAGSSTVGLMMTACHVPSLSCAELLHHRIALSRCLLPAETPQRQIERGLSDQMNPAKVLRDSGIVVLGDVDPALIQRVRTYSESPNTKQSRYQRQTELEWNGDCDAVFEFFETVSGREPARDRSLF